MIAARDSIAARDREAGFSLVEVVIASLLLVLAAGAAFGVLGAATKNAHRAKGTQVALDRAQAEMEELRRLEYGSLALARLPEASADRLDPNSRVRNGEFALERDPPGEYAPLVVKDGALEPEYRFPAPGEERGGISGTVYRYVVEREEPGCDGESCEYKQVVVAVKLDGGALGERGYVEVQSKFSAPREFQSSGPASGGSSGPPGSEGGVTAQQFFLSDTPCSPDGATVRREIVEDHLLHNTLGTCADGEQSGATPGAPDALLLSTPPDPAPEDETLPPLFDYSNDHYLEPTPNTDRGLQIKADDTGGCHFDPTGTATPQAQIHRWVSDPMADPFALTGEVTLELYTRTLNDALYKGGLCVFLFSRHESGSITEPVAEDTLLVNAKNGSPYWVYSSGAGFWPRNAWTRVRLTMSVAGTPLAIPSGDRLGVALGVDPALTQGDAIPVIYDHPDYPSRVEVDTETPIEVGEEAGGAAGGAGG